MERYKLHTVITTKSTMQKNGIYLELPHGYNNKDRQQAAAKAEVEYDYCAFFYTDDE